MVTELAPRLAIPRAACNLLVSLDPPIIPTTSFTAPGSIGDQQIEVDDLRYFLDSVVLSIWDRTEEGPVIVDHTDPDGHGLDPDPVPGTIYLKQPLAFDHEIGAKIVTNLLDTFPARPDEMIENGWPVFSSFLLEEQDRRPENIQWMGSGPVIIMCQLKASRPNDSDQHPQLYTRDQIARIESDFQRVKAAVLTGRVLRDQWGNAVVWSIEQIDQPFGLNNPPVTSGGAALWESWLQIHARWELIPAQ